MRRFAAVILSARTAFGVVAAMSISCGSSTSTPSPTTPSSSSPAAATVVSATMSGANVTLASVGQTSQIVVTGTFSDGTTADITSSTAVSTSDLTVASANLSGLVTAWGQGTAVLTAIYERNPVHALTSGTVTVLNGPSTEPSLAPILTSPTNGSSFPNGCAGSCTEPTWTFSWTPVAGATAYHLVVLGATATLPAVDVAGITNTTYANHPLGVLIPADLNGWTWRVQAQVNGVYRTWSLVGTFNVLP
jgi:hypothetical protein